VLEPEQTRFEMPRLSSPKASRALPGELTKEKHRNYLVEADWPRAPAGRSPQAPQMKY
jgi:hypothetical protein